MARSGLLIIAIISIILAISVQQAFGLQCWQCIFDSKDAKSPEYCQDPFDTNKASGFKLIAYSNCTPPAGQTAYCRKTIDLVNNGTVISRSCFYKKSDAPKDLCADSTQLKNVKTEICELCNDVDGCNGASQFTSITLFVAISIGFVQMFASQF